LGLQKKVVIALLQNPPHTRRGRCLQAVEYCFSNTNSCLNHKNKKSGAAFVEDEYIFSNYEY